MERQRYLRDEHDDRVPRCQVMLDHAETRLRPASASQQCVLRADHQENDSDHVDRHGCKAPVLVTQATIRQVQALQDSDDAYRAEGHNHMSYEADESCPACHPQASKPATTDTQVEIRYMPQFRKHGGAWIDGFTGYGFEAPEQATGWADSATMLGPYRRVVQRIIRETVIYEVN